MGLPLFITPVEPEVASGAAEKIASAPRSSIRRQRTLRGPHAQMAAETRRRRIMGLLPEAEPEEFEAAEGEQGNTPDHVRGIPSASFQMRALRMVEHERLRRDLLSLEREDPSNVAVDGPLMPPVPESRDYTAAEDNERRRQMHRLRQVRHDILTRARRYRDSPRLSSSLTPILSPPHQPSTEDIDSPPRQPRGEPESSLLGTVPQHTVGPIIPTLSEQLYARPINNIIRSQLQHRQARLDGLGDRDRSLSPEGDRAGWDTLWTTLTPDPQPPSAGSSFASTSAAAAAAASGPSLASASTSTTSPDRPGEHECDMSDLEPNTEDELEERYEFQEIYGGTRRIDLPGRTYADVVSTRADSVAAGQDTRPTNLGGMHRIVSRLERRDEIPDNYWASARLSRNLRREPTN